MCKSFMDYSISHLETSIDLELYLRSRLSRHLPTACHRSSPTVFAHGLHWPLRIIAEQWASMFLTSSGAAARERLWVDRMPCATPSPELVALSSRLPHALLACQRTPLSHLSACTLPA
ncbi:methionine ABC transporter ATP-binding protein [Striga asiatica]|uniref:Methionine ABC transporter ATP-binding protein n=1 Tax=Striga asiatica TaxID=4170 RepID=A0A5A7P5B9_STRAF|nr:methionine ABC transporter ATP-binding protein [Striga asiatica]